MKINFGKISPDTKICDAIPEVGTGVKSPVKFDDFSAYLINGEHLLLRKNNLFYTGYWDIDPKRPINTLDYFFSNHSKVVCYDPACAVSTKTKKGKEIVLYNADSEESNINRTETLSVSFDCIAMLVGKNGQAAIDKITVIEATKDETIYPIDDKRIKNIKIYKEYETQKLKISPPEFGFNLQFYSGKAYWHRTGSCLFTYNKKYYLVGRDEDTYFGVELPSKANSLNDAYRILIPKELLKRTDWKRQGEWYIVPVDETKVPAKSALTILQSIGLPIDDPDSNIHEVIAERYVFNKNELYALNGSLNHDEHNDITWKGWATFMKNTAVRSVSVDGVD